MEKKVVKKKAGVKKSVRAKQLPSDPFDSLAEPIAEPVAEAAPKTKRRITKAADKVKSASAKARSTRAKKASIDVVEPFAEIALESSPVKKSSPRSATKTDKPVKAEAKTTKKKTVKRTARSKKADPGTTSNLVATEPEATISSTFKQLADVRLPELKRENRARLLIQSPTRLYFYWSIKEDPWHQLRRVFPDDFGGYMLVLKLKNLTRDSEELYQCDVEGNWWFAVEPDCEYQAEVGFYAVNRPYFRIIYSNAVTTPRRSPSPRPASDSKWAVSAAQFAEVLDASGFSADAFDVALAGDDQAAASDVAHVAFANFIGTNETRFDGVTAEDIRYALLAIASGFTLEELRWKVSPTLFAILQTNPDKLTSSRAQSSLAKHFEIHEAEWTEEELSSAVYGGSLVHFPKTLKHRKVNSALLPRYKPISSMVRR